MQQLQDVLYSGTGALHPALLGARPLPALLGLINVRAKSCQADPGQGPSLAVLCCSHWARAGQARISWAASAPPAWVNPATCNSQLLQKSVSVSFDSSHMFILCTRRFWMLVKLENGAELRAGPSQAGEAWS